MNKTYLIFRHEFLQALKRISFYVLTFTVPLLGLVSILAIDMFWNDSEPPETEAFLVGYVDEAGFIDEEIATKFGWPVPFPSEEEATQALLGEEISEFVVIPADYTATNTVQRFTIENELGTPPFIAGMIKSFLTANILKNDVPTETITLIISPLNLQATRLDESGNPTTDQFNIGNIIVPSLFSFLLGFAFIFGASSLISGLGEEKESRLIEVLFSSVSIRQLLVGKIFALGTAGLLQVLVWLISAPLLLNLASAKFGGFMSDVQIPANFILLAIVYFILGYLLFAILSVATGAICPNVREANQLSTFYLLASFVPLWFSSLFFMFPESPVWIFLTIFPPTAPVETLFRMGVSDVPTWQLVASISTLTVSVVGGLYLAIKIFRVYMLMYGTRPGLRQIVQSLKEA